MDDSWNSDHILIEITFNEILLIEQAQISKFKFKKADWETFKMVCKDNINSTLINPSNEVTNKILLNQSSGLQICVYQRKKPEQKRWFPIGTSCSRKTESQKENDQNSKPSSLLRV